MRNAEVTLPLAVALFRATGPAMNISVAIYVAYMMGIELNAGNLIVGGILFGEGVDRVPAAEVGPVHRGGHDRVTIEPELLPRFWRPLIRDGPA